MVDQWLETDENRALLAISARRSIKGVGVGSIIWGIFNIALGISYVADSPINVVVLLLGALMLAVGIHALVKPTLIVLLLAAIVSILLLLWNIFVAVLNVSVTQEFNPRGLILPLIIAFTFMQQYRKFRPIRTLIANITREAVKRANALSKTISKSKLKTSPDILAASGTHGAWRIQLLEDRAFFVAQNGSHLFVMPREAGAGAIDLSDADKSKILINHPMGAIKLKLDKQNTETLRAWLESTVTEPGDTTTDSPTADDSAAEDMEEQAIPS